MSVGYSQATVRANKSANGKRQGVRLGRVCIRRNISVTEVANDFGVSRQTIYNWFSGVCEPDKETSLNIRSYIHDLRKYYTD
jgi:transcriptional regulator with XRE-family HTH domain